MAVDLQNQTINLRNFVPVDTGSANDGKILSRFPNGNDTEADLIFSMSIVGGVLQNQTSETAQEGGGYGAFFADSSNGVGPGISGTNIDVITITDDPLFGTVSGLRNTYQGGGTAYTFGNQTYFLIHPARAKFYIRMRIKFSSNWEWGNDQLKFCKNTGTGISTNCPKFVTTSGIMNLTKLVDGFPGTNDKNVFATLTGTGETPSAFNAEDDINNQFGMGGTDINFSPILNQWYWFEWEVDAGTLGQSNGSFRIWIDGDLYMSLDNVQVGEVGDSLFERHELGHVWQNGSPTQDISMDWHNIEIYSERPSTLPGVF